MARVILTAFMSHILLGVLGLAVAALLVWARRKHTAHESDLSRLQTGFSALEKSYDHTLEMLGSVIDQKELESTDHSKRVTAFTIAIARHIGVTRDEIRVIARGAFLHDVGMSCVPDALIRKPGMLSPEELAVLREHCFRGYEMVRPIPYLQDAAEIIYSHHERFDGTGYPRGLKGQNIPLGARIFAIADTLEAITSDRPYRRSRPMSEAREEIQRWSGRQFDPEIVQAFLSMPENIWTDLRNEIDPRK